MKTILVIDDDVQFLRTIDLTLRSKDFATLVAHDAVEGLDLARKGAPDLILSDIQMNCGDGYSILEALRGDSVTASIPFILMTGNGDNHGMRRGMALGADDYLIKPFTKEELLAAVAARLSRQAVIHRRAEAELADLRMRLSLMLPHELNTPLTGVLAAGEILQTQGGDLTAGELAEVGDNLVRAGRRLQRLIQNFLLYSETELLVANPRGILSQRGLQLAAARQSIEAVAYTVARRYSRGEDLRMDVPEGISSILSPELVGKIMDELLDNAFKFSKPGTPVTVRASSGQRDWEVEIIDQGRGISPQQVAAMGPFVQFERAQHEQQGAGLGYTIAKRIVELHGGAMRIASELGAGARVTVRLPSTVASAQPG